MMRILMTTDSIGGVWSYTLELCRALTSHGVHIELAVMGALPTEAQRKQAQQLARVRLYGSAFRLEWMSNPWDDVSRAGEWLLGLERQTAPDLVHLNHLLHADLPWRAPVISVGHSCVLSWWQAVHGVPAPAQWDYYRERVTASLRAAACVVAPTQAMLTELERYYGPFRQSAVIYNARNRWLFKAGVKQPIILCAGRLWDKAKNLEALSKVAAALPSPVFAAGASRSPDGNSVGFAHIQMLGPLDTKSLADWYARAAIYALPARYEPFGLTALEAAMSGCALVLSDIASLREVWGPSARYVPPHDRERLKDTLNELIVNDSVRKRCAARAMARARQFTPARQEQQYRLLYRELLGSRRPLRSACSEPG
jgi:glycosyltransferase involved in cell wall biosynthesis